MNAATMLRTARVLHTALVAGPLAFALVALWLQRGMAAADFDADTQRLLRYVWMAAAVGSLLLALNLWRTRVAPHIEAIAGGETAEPPQELLSGLILVWALIEGAALFGLVMYLVTGLSSVWIGSVVLILGNAVFGRPRTEWFEPAAGRP